MVATFTYRGVSYTVSGWLWSQDGASNSMIVAREDGRPIRGASMHLGMVQLGLSAALERAARQALEAERARERDAS